MNNIFKYVLPKNWGIVKVYRDFENFNDWKRIINREKANKDSKFNKWKLEHTKLYDLFITVSLDDADANLPEVVKRTKLLEYLNPLNRYLDEELGFAGSLSIEFNQFENDKHELTLTYHIVYRFIFEKFSLKWLAKTVLYISLITWAFIHYNVIEWLLTLI